MRKMLHTPKNGIILPETNDFYVEQINNNDYLRDFIDRFDKRLNEDINKHVKKMHCSSLKS